MPIADVRRAYTPKCDYQSQTFFQQSLANIQAMSTYPNKICRVSVVPELVHRKIWAYILSISGTYSHDVDVVCRLHGSEVYRQKLSIQNTAAVNTKYQFCAATMASGVGGQREQLITTVASTTNFGICPLQLNIACDEVSLFINGLTGAAAAWDLGLHVLSQAGI
jgi:hypothetical protein